MERLVRKYAEFTPLTAEEREVLMRLPSRHREFRSGDIIVAQGDSPSESIVVLAGLAFRFKQLPDGPRQILALHLPGDFVDLHSLVLKPLDHGLAAASTTFVAMVPHERLDKIITSCPNLTRALMWDLALDAAITRQWMTMMGQRSAYRQVAHFLCELYFRLERVGLLRDGGFELQLTQEQIGEALGLSGVHVNRSLQALRKEGLIESTRKRLFVPDIGALVRMARFDPAYLRLVAPD